MSASDTATVVSNLIGPITGIMVPLIGTTVLAIVNFIEHHVHTTPRQKEALDRIATLEGKIMTVDTQIDSMKGAIGTFAGSDPRISATVQANEKRIADAEATIAQLTDEISKLKALVPTS